MKLSKFKDDYHFFSGKASDISRQFAFAGIAVVWVFKTESNTLPQELYFPTLLIVASMILDLFHYTAATIVWKLFHRSKEKDPRFNENSDVKAPIIYSQILSIFFYGKILLNMTALVFLLVFGFGEVFGQ